ncbi:MAG TPA: hypothetical protein VG860_12745 [Terriglobia bacterium]|jgi:hypothetical protein|nr:hypothetical protein [Terriglobia bacterium]
MTIVESARRAVAGAAVASLALAGMLLCSPRARAQDGNDDSWRIKQGFAIAPVPLNLKGKSPEQIDLVGLGSYWVNAVSDCDFCHTSGGPPSYNFAAGFNPYFGQSKKTDPATYLAGGANFGTALPVGFYNPLYGNYPGPYIISRNLTPNKYGLPEGGKTLAQFMQVLRTGVDQDHIHPTCTTAFPHPGPPDCIPPPVDGSLLQVMPWPDFQDMSDHDIEAIYEYLSAIPCIDNKTSTPPFGAPNELRNDCGDDPPAGADNASETPRGTRR